MDQTLRTFPDVLLPNSLSTLPGVIDLVSAHTELQEGHTQSTVHEGRVQQHKLMI